MVFGSDAGAVYERARTNFGPAGQDLYDKTDGAIVVLAVVEFALAEARKSEDGLGIDWLATIPLGTGGTYPGATQSTMTPLDLTGNRVAICLTTKIASSFETL